MTKPGPEDEDAKDADDFPKARCGRQRRVSDLRKARRAVNELR